MIDAKRIDPKMSRMVFIPDLTQSLDEICSHKNLMTLAGNRANIFSVAPGVRYCFVFLEGICILVSLIMNIVVSEDRNSLPAD